MYSFKIICLSTWIWISLPWLRFLLELVYSITCNVILIVDLKLRLYVPLTFYTFDTVDTAKRAKQNLNGADVYSGCCTLKIDFAKVSDFYLASYQKVLHTERNILYQFSIHNGGEMFCSIIDVLKFFSNILFIMDRYFISEPLDDIWNATFLYCI
jgi:hypothetical protein